MYEEAFFHTLLWETSMELPELGTYQREHVEVSGFVYYVGQSVISSYAEWVVGRDIQFKHHWLRLGDAGKACALQSSCYLGCS